MRCDRHPPARTARTRASRCGLRPSHSSAPRAGRQPLAGRAPPLGGIVPPGVAIARKRGGAPLRRPASLYFGITRVRNRSLPGRLNVWTRIWRSLPRPVPMLISENVGECARPRCYRVSVARTTGPDPAISSVFTGLASLVGRFDTSRSLTSKPPTSTRYRSRHWARSGRFRATAAPAPPRRRA